MKRRDFIQLIGLAPLAAVAKVETIPAKESQVAKSIEVEDPDGWWATVSTVTMFSSYRAGTITTVLDSWPESWEPTWRM